MKKALLFTFLGIYLGANAQNISNLSDRYYSGDPIIQHKVDSIFKSLSDEQIVAQLLMPAVGKYGQEFDTIQTFINEGLIGGVLMLNGTKEQFTSWIKDFNQSIVKRGDLPFLYSADAEPSLVNRKIIGSAPVKKANQVASIDEAIATASVISNDLNEIGINYNFAPVVDVSTNKTVGYRGFGSVEMNLVPFSEAFIEETQNNNIIATAKHFPGHGLVSGDTHASLQVIDGEMKELSNYPPLIKQGVLSIMIAHIAVKNNKDYNTDGLPATNSEKIVTHLLRDSLGFNGLIVTDAMNMGGVAKVANANVGAIDAGCDILLMPLNVRVAHKEILDEFNNNEEFRAKAEASAKRIIRMKVCMGLIP